MIENKDLCTKAEMTEQALILGSIIIFIIPVLDLGLLAPVEMVKEGKCLPM